MDSELKEEFLEGYYEPQVRNIVDLKSALSSLKNLNVLKIDMEIFNYGIIQLMDTTFACPNLEYLELGHIRYNKFYSTQSVDLFYWLN